MSDIDKAAEVKNVGDGQVTCEKDPWKHRSKGMQCATCMWFAEKVTDPPALEPNKFGRCRRHAPTMNGYPAVFGADWCGDHKLDENKI
jgi:hypothetical protein